MSLVARIDNGVTYTATIGNSVCTVTKYEYDGLNANVTIPQSINIPTDSDPLYNITVINSDVFDSNTDLTSISMESADYLTSLLSNTFRNCSSLVTITLSNSINH